MLVVAREECDVGASALDCAQPTVADRRSDAASDIVANDHGRTMGASLIAGAVGGAVIDDDRLETPVARKLVEHAADLSCFIQCRNDDGYERFWGQGQAGTLLLVLTAPSHTMFVATTKR